MEIERKFLIQGFLEETPVKTYEMLQGYLSWDPVVRIRSRASGSQSDYKLCVKGKGTLVRRELELPLSGEQFGQLCELLPAPPVHKVQRVYRIAQSLFLECNCVNPGTALEFWYAEVEFGSVEQANGFVPPPYLGTELTHCSGFTMSDYCRDPQAFLAHLREFLDKGRA